jgi:ParB family chromosome partitioning protein
MKDIKIHTGQCRDTFEHEKLMELVNSIREGELLQPIVVRRLPNDKYGIVCGERRFRAFEYLKEKQIPAVIRGIKDDTDLLEKSLIENWVRADLTDVEKRNAINELWKSGQYKTKAELSRKTGIAKGTIEDTLEAIEFEVRVPHISKGTSFTALRSTRGLSDGVRKKIIETAVKEGIPARELEEDIVPKVKKFDPEVQKEAFSRMVERRKQDKEIEEAEVENDVKRAKGEAELEWHIYENPEEIRFNTLKDKCNAMFTITPINITGIKNEKFKKQSVELLKRTEKYLHKLLVTIGEYPVVEHDDI